MKKQNKYNHIELHPSWLVYFSTVHKIKYEYDEIFAMTRSFSLAEPERDRDLYSSHEHGLFILIFPFQHLQSGQISMYALRPGDYLRTILTGERWEEESGDGTDSTRWLEWTLDSGQWTLLEIRNATKIGQELVETWVVEMV